MRSSGVAVGPDNRIYVTDQVRNQLVIFDAARQFERSLSFGNVPTGLAVAPDGSLLAASFREDALRRTPLPADGTSTVVLSGINEPSDVAFAKDGSYYLSLGSTLQHRAADHSLLKSISTDEFTDSLVVFIPEPTSLATTCLVFLFLRRRSRSSAAT
jgi:DNA-binding beta-propeller fold protein YncE